MFERFTDASRRVVVYGQEESRARADGYIGSAHLLLGLLHIGDDTASVITDAGMTIAQGREWLGGHRGRRRPGGQRTHPVRRGRETDPRGGVASGRRSRSLADRHGRPPAGPPRHPGHDRTPAARRPRDGLTRLQARLRSLPRTAQIFGPAARTASSGPTRAADVPSHLVAGLQTYSPHLDGCRPDGGCTCGLDALLREFPRIANDHMGGDMRRRVESVRGDITTQSVDAIVNAANRWRPLAGT